MAQGALPFADVKTGDGSTLRDFSAPAQSIRPRFLILWTMRTLAANRWSSPLAISPGPRRVASQSRFFVEVERGQGHGRKQRRRTGGLHEVTRSSCYTDLVLKNMTITVEEEVARWARRKAAEENTSVSKLVGQMLAENMKRSDDYWQAYEHWKSVKGFPARPGVKMPTREEAHERKR